MDEVAEAIEKYHGLVPLVYDIETMGLAEARPQDMYYAVYLKREADKVIAHNKYKRCLAMAKRCEAEAHKRLTQQCALVSFQETDRFQYLQRNFMHFSRWHKRWLKIAKHFKEAK